MPINFQIGCQMKCGVLAKLGGADMAAFGNPTRQFKAALAMLKKEPSRYASTALDRERFTRFAGGLV